MLLRNLVENKFLFFDFDGTLVVTESTAQRVVIEELHEMGVKNPEFYSKHIVGRTWKAAVQSMVLSLRQEGEGDFSEEELWDRFRSLYLKQIQKGVEWIPGAKEFVKKVQSSARFVGIVTGSEHHEVDLILNAAGMRDCFQRVWAYGDYSESKPSPSPYVTALLELGVSPQDALVFEDSSAGMQSSKAAQIPWVQVRYEAHCPAHHPDSVCVISTYDELLRN